MFLKISNYIISASLLRIWNLLLLLMYIWDMKTNKMTQAYLVWPLVWPLLRFDPYLLCNSLHLFFHKKGSKWSNLISVSCQFLLNKLEIYRFFLEKLIHYFHQKIHVAPGHGIYSHILYLCLFLMKPYVDKSLGKLSCEFFQTFFVQYNIVLM